MNIKRVTFWVIGLVVVLVALCVDAFLFIGYCVAGVKRETVLWCWV